MSLPLIVAFWSRILHLKSNIDKNQIEIPSLLMITFGISEIFAILNYPNLVICISNVTAIDYNIMVYNFTFKVTYRQNWRVIPSLLAINFGICEIFAILYYLNLDTCIDNVSAIDCSILVQNFTFKVKYRQKSNRNSKFAHDQFWDKWDICHSELSKPCHLYQ